MLCRSRLIGANIAVALFLAGCLGGGASPGVSLGPDAPAPGLDETPETGITNYQEILATLTVNGNWITSGGDLELADAGSIDEGERYTDIAICRETVCDFDSGARVSVTSIAIAAGSLLLDSPASQHHSGVMKSRGWDGDDEEYDDFLGGWMENSAFFVLHDREAWSHGALLGVETYSVGVASGTNPVGGPGVAGAYWGGIMLGRDVASPRTFGRRVEGSAQLVYRFEPATLDVDFYNLTGERPDIVWTGIPVDKGVFTSYDGSWWIQGSFFGDNWQEAGGVFEAAGVMGAFGAKHADHLYIGETP